MDKGRDIVIVPEISPVHAGRGRASLNVSNRRNPRTLVKDHVLSRVPGLTNHSPTTNCAASKIAGSPRQCGHAVRVPFTTRMFAPSAPEHWSRTPLSSAGSGWYCHQYTQSVERIRQKTNVDEACLSNRTLSPTGCDRAQLQYIFSDSSSHSHRWTNKYRRPSS